MSIVNRFPGAILRPTGFFGYPYVGSTRRIKPTILQVVHITDGYGIPAPASTKSWTFSVARDGTVYQFLDPVTQAPWTNGDIKSPDLSNSLIARMDLARYNPNEYCFITVENVGYLTGAGERLTAEQLEANHAIAVWGSKLSGLPVDREHIIGHYQINSVTRSRCPTVPDDRARVFNGVVNGLTLPDTAVGDDMELTKYEAGVARLDGNAVIRKAPRLTDDAKWFTVGAGGASVQTFIGWTKGDVYNGSDKWGVYVVASQTPPIIAYTHEINVKEIQPYSEFFHVEVQPGITQAELESAVAQAKADGLTAGATKEKSRLRTLLGL